MMNRRDALQRVGWLMGGAVSLPTMIAVLEGCTTASKDAVSLFSTDQASLISEIAEMIIPKTSTPGAKDAKVGEFIQLMIKDCYTEAQQKHFLAGLDAIEAESQKAHKIAFTKANGDQKTAILKQFEQMAKDEQKKNEDNLKASTEKKIIDAETGKAKETAKKSNEPPVPFFKLAKELTLLGYFTSEAGATQALVYEPIPGRFEGCVKLQPNQKAWAI